MKIIKYKGTLFIEGEEVSLDVDGLTETEVFDDDTDEDIKLAISDFVLEQARKQGYVPKGILLTDIEIID